MMAVVAVDVIELVAELDAEVDIEVDAEVDTVVLADDVCVVDGVVRSHA